MAYQRQNQNKPKPPDPIKPPDKIPSRKAWYNSDQGFLNTQTALDRAFTRYKNQAATARSDVNADWTTSLAGMRKQKRRDLSSIEQDYGGRGLLTSGLYGQAQNQYTTDWGDQKDAAKLAVDRAIKGINTGVGDQRLIRKQQMDAARLDSLRRRNTQYGLTGGAVLSGGS